MTRLRIQLPNYFHPDVEGIPVRVEVRDEMLDLVSSIFVPFGNLEEVDVQPGTYMVEAEMPSGQKIREVTRTVADGTTDVVMRTAGLSPHEFHAWAYLNKNATHRPARSFNAPEFEGTWVRLWRKKAAQDAWEIISGELGDESSWDGDGVNYRLKAFGGMQVLQLGGPQVAWKCVALPGAHDLKILVRPADGPEEQVHPLDVVVSTHNTGAEAMLSMLNSGAIDQAKAMENSGAAELMLYSKITDPTAAAIGGYFLLKTGDLGRLHDWTANLANWIDWMADGAIIRAWHLLKSVRYEGMNADEAHGKARALLLEAVNRGFPIYTEGLRLLRDGINILSRNPNDNEARDAKAIVDGYAQSCDWTAPTTTFLGEAPDEPAPQAKLGKPENFSNLVFLYNVDAEELIRQGVVSVGSKLTLDRFEDTAIEVTVEEGGELNLEGKRYKHLQDITQSIGMPETQQYEWISEQTGEPMFEEMQNLRHGRFTVIDD